MSQLAWGLLVCFWLLLAAAAISDLRSLRISNTIVVATLAVAIALLFVRGGTSPWWEHAASFAIMLAAGVALFGAGWVGGGDAKLFAAAAVLFDLRELVGFVVITALAGGLLTILLYLFRRFRRRPGGSWLGLAPGRAIPYGVAIALGAAAASVMAMVP